MQERAFLSFALIFVLRLDRIALALSIYKQRSAMGAKSLEKSGAGLKRLYGYPRVLERSGESQSTVPS